MDGVGKIPESQVAAEESGIAQTRSNVPLTQEESTAGSPSVSAGQNAYRTYRRRWVGLVQLVLLNIVISWDWLTYSPVVNDAAVFFSTTPSVVNWLSTAFLFSFVVSSPVVLWALYSRGPKFSLVTASCLILAGNWIRYGGTKASPAPSYAAVMVGQILCGLAQPFVLTASTTYSELWFTPRGRMSATAVTSLANPLGGAIGELVNPYLSNGVSGIDDMTLYVAIIASAAAIPSFFIPAKPPSPVAMSSTISLRPVREELHDLVRLGSFWLIAIPFAVYVGFFNSLSSLIVQILSPYGYSETDSSIAGALLILVGLVSAAVVSPLMDKYKKYLLAIRALVPVIAASYLTFIWAPSAGTIAAAYVICSVLGAASFSLMPVALEALAEVTYPVAPSFSSVTCWTGGQFLGAIFIIISDALEDDAGRFGPPGNLMRALIFQAVIAIAAAPCAIALGWGKGLQARRLAVDGAT